MTRTFRYQDIASSIRADIAEGAFAAEGVLPSEAELSAAHGASRVTIRRALEHLRNEGLVASRQGFGWFVGADPVRQSLDSLETIEHQLFAAGRTSERRVLSFRFCDAPSEIAALLGSEVLEVVRLNLADDQPFALVTVWCAAEVGAALSRADVEQSTFVDLLRERLGPARQIISATAADAGIAQQIGVEVGAPLLRVRRVTTARSGGNVLVSEHIYPADQTEFEVTLHTPGDGPAGLRLID